MANLFYYEEKGKRYVFRGKIIDEAQIKEVSNLKRIRILELLSKHELLSGEEIASIMKEDVFSIYYHLRKLEKARLVHLKNQTRIRNFEEKRYSFDADALVLFLNDEFKSKAPISEGSLLRGIIVVGSPDAHGKFNLRARDGYLAGVLGSFLGSKGWNIDVTFDTLFSEEDIKDGTYVFVIGGPLTNMLTYKLNKKMKVYYDEEVHYRGIRSSITKNQYNEESMALICKIIANKVPYVLLSGINIISTEISINAFKSIYDEIMSRDEAYIIIEGVDRDSDGKMEDFEILERYP